MRRIVALFFILLVALAFPGPASAHDTLGSCHFHDHFATLRNAIGHYIVGDCLNNEHPNSSGDRVQLTSGGLLVLRLSSDNRAVFTDGGHTWLIGPDGLAKRLNTETFAWESTPTSQPSPPPTPTPIPPPRPTIDPRLVPALTMVASNVIGEELIAFAYHNGVSFVVDPIDGLAGTEIAGTYDYFTNTVTIDSSYLEDAPTKVIAAVLVHEITHALPIPTEWYQLSQTEMCFRIEIAAEWKVGHWWHMRYFYRGDTDFNHPAVERLNRVAEYVRDRAIRGNIRRLERYVRERWADLCALG